MITIRHTGNFNRTKKFFESMVAADYMSILEKYARKGVDALASATPVDSGETAQSWNYEIKHDRKSTSIIWTNSHVVDGIPVAILIQYGHATRNGGYVEGRDFINPALRPIFDQIADDIWREASKL